MPLCRSTNIRGFTCKVRPSYFREGTGVLCCAPWCQGYSIFNAGQSPHRQNRLLLLLWTVYQLQHPVRIKRYDCRCVISAWRSPSRMQLHLSEQTSEALLNMPRRSCCETAVSAAPRTCTPLA